MPPKKLTPAGVVTMFQLLPFQCSVNGPSSWCPTAHTSPVETPATATRPLLPCGFGLGLGTTLQLVPSQCSITAVGCAENPPVGTPGPVPAAHTSAGDSAATVTTPPNRRCAAGFRVQLVPFQCRLTFSSVVELVARNPIAHASVAESAEITPLLMLTLVKAGLVTMLQLVPSQCSTRALAEPPANPTAQALLVAGAVTPVSALPWGSLGLGVTAQLVPSQCSISGMNELPCAWSPTAHTSLPAAPATPPRAASRAGVGTTLQLVPLKCSASAWTGPLPPPTVWNGLHPVPVPMSPTAHMSAEPITAAPDRHELVMTGLGATCRPEVAAAGTAPTAPASSAAIPAEKSMPTMRGFMVPHFPPQPRVRYAARLPVARPSPPRGSPPAKTCSKTRAFPHAAPRAPPPAKPRGPPGTAACLSCIRGQPSALRHPLDLRPANHPANHAQNSQIGTVLDVNRI